MEHKLEYEYTFRCSIVPPMNLAHTQAGVAGRLHTTWTLSSIDKHHRTVQFDALRPLLSEIAKARYEPPTAALLASLTPELG